MPNLRGGVETQSPALFLDAPADIDIVSGRAKLRVETANHDAMALPWDGSNA